MQTDKLDKTGADDKYGMDAPFEDPLVRCDGCKKMILFRGFMEVGRCPECGSNRIRNLQLMTQVEHDMALKWGVDPDFMALFEGKAHGFLSMFAEAPKCA